MSVDFGKFNDNIKDYVLTNSDFKAFENLISIQEGSLYFAQSVGIDSDFWLYNSELDFDATSFNEYLQEKALSFGLVGIIESNIDNKDTQVAAIFITCPATNETEQILIDNAL